MTFLINLNPIPDLPIQNVYSHRGYKQPHLIITKQKSESLHQRLNLKISLTKKALIVPVVLDIVAL